MATNNKCKNKKIRNAAKKWSHAIKVNLALDKFHNHFNQYILKEKVQAIATMCIWETERILRQVKSTGGTYESTFEFIISETTNKWITHAYVQNIRKLEV